MSTIYKWDSPKKANEVLDTILSITDKKTRIRPFTCTYKQPNINEVEFTLWYYGGRYSFDAPSLKGTIRTTETGCVISAEKKFVMSYIGNAITIVAIIIFYIAGVAAIFADFHLSFIPAIIFFLLAIGVTWHFVYTFKKYSNLKVHLDIMDTAAKVKHQIISF